MESGVAQVARAGAPVIVDEVFLGRGLAGALACARLIAAQVKARAVSGLPV